MPRTFALMRRLAAWTALSLAALSCGGSGTPTASSSPVPAPTPTIPVSPTPPPGGGQGSLPSACSGTPPSGSLKSCLQRPAAVLQSQVESVVNQVKAKGPLIFYDDGLTIRNLDEFRKEIGKGFNNLGICALWDYGIDGAGVGDELYLYSRSEGLNEVWQTISSQGKVRFAGYMSTCEPAIPFPEHYVPSYPVQDPQCPLPASGYTFCLDRSAVSVYSDDVRAAIVQVQQQHPELFDFGDCLGELSCRLTDAVSYVDRVIEAMRQRGYCVIEQDELAVKKDNSFNENFDIVRTPESRPGQYSQFVYKGKCQDALF